MEIKIGGILCPVYFSRPSSHALKYAVALAEEYGARLYRLHVSEGSKSDISDVHDTTRWIPSKESTSVCRSRLL